MVSWCFTFVRNLIIISSEHEYIVEMAFFQYLMCSMGHNSKTRLIRVMVFVFCLSTFVRNFIIISQMLFNLQRGHEYMVELAMFNIERAITPKVGNQSYRSWILQVLS